MQGTKREHHLKLVWLYTLAKIACYSFWNDAFSVSQKMHHSDAFDEGLQTGTLHEETNH